MSDLPGKYDPNFPYPPVYDASEPQPDPAWEYLDVYGRSRIIQEQIEHLMTFLKMEPAEYQNPNVDQVIREHLQQITAQSNQILNSLS